MADSAVEAPGEISSITEENDASPSVASHGPADSAEQPPENAAPEAAEEGAADEAADEAAEERSAAKSPKVRRRHKKNKKRRREASARKSGSHKRKRPHQARESPTSDEDEEEEEEEEAVLREEMRGFIVSEEEDVSDSDATSSASSRDDGGEEDGPAQLDDEDLALIAENTGLVMKNDTAREETEGPPQQLFRRLKKSGGAVAAVEASEQDGLSTNLSKTSGIERRPQDSLQRGDGVSEEEEGASEGGKEETRVARRRRSGSQAEEAEEDDLSADGGDDEEAEEEEDGALPASGREPHAQQRLLADAWGLIAECFGDVDSVLNIICNKRPEPERRSDDERERERERDALLVGSPRASQLQGLPPRSQILADEDFPALDDGAGDEADGRSVFPLADSAKKSDFPERLAARFAGRPSSVSEARLAAEASWISARLAEDFPELVSLEEVGQRYVDAFNGSCRLQRSPPHDLTQKVGLLLRLLLVQRNEVVFILRHQMHLLSPPLDEASVWKVYELDALYWRQRGVKLQLLQILLLLLDEIRRKDGVLVAESAKASFQRLIRQAESEQDLEELRLHFLCAYPNIAVSVHQQLEQALKEKRRQMEGQDADEEEDEDEDEEEEADADEGDDSAFLGEEAALLEKKEQLSDGEEPGEDADEELEDDAEEEFAGKPLNGEAPPEDAEEELAEKLAAEAEEELAEEADEEPAEDAEEELAEKPAEAEEEPAEDGKEDEGFEDQVPQELPQEMPAEEEGGAELSPIEDASSESEEEAPSHQDEAEAAEGEPRASDFPSNTRETSQDGGDEGEASQIGEPTSSSAEPEETLSQKLASEAAELAPLSPPFQQTQVAMLDDLPPQNQDEGEEPFHADAEESESVFFSTEQQHSASLPDEADEEPLPQASQQTSPSSLEEEPLNPAQTDGQGEASTASVEVQVQEQETPPLFSSDKPEGGGSPTRAAKEAEAEEEGVPPARSVSSHFASPQPRAEVAADSAREDGSESDDFADLLDFSGDRAKQRKEQKKPPPREEAARSYAEPDEEDGSESDELEDLFDFKGERPKKRKVSAERSAATATERGRGGGASEEEAVLRFQEKQRRLQHDWRRRQAMAVAVAFTDEDRQNEELEASQHQALLLEAEEEDWNDAEALAASRSLAPRDILPPDAVQVSADAAGEGLLRRRFLPRAKASASQTLFGATVGACVQLALRYKLADVWRDFLISPDEFAANLSLCKLGEADEEFSLPPALPHAPAETPDIPSATQEECQESIALLRQQRPSGTLTNEEETNAALEAAVASWSQRLFAAEAFPTASTASSSLAPGRQALQLLVLHHAKQLASNVQVRRAVKAAVAAVAAVSTVPKKVTEAADPANPHWIALRLSRLPVKTFLADAAKEARALPNPWESFSRQNPSPRRFGQRAQREEPWPRAWRLKALIEERTANPIPELFVHVGGSCIVARLHFSIREARREAAPLPGVSVQVQHLERAGEVSVHLHPTSPIETPPWRRPEFVSQVLELDKKLTALQTALAESARRPNAKGLAQQQEFVELLTQQCQLIKRQRTEYEQTEKADIAMVGLLVEQLLFAYSGGFSATTYPNGRNAGNPHPGASSAWLFVQRSILRRMLLHELLPQVKRSLRNQLLRASQNAVLRRCQAMLAWKLDVQPVKPASSLLQQRLEQLRRGGGGSDKSSSEESSSSSSESEAADPEAPEDAEKVQRRRQQRRQKKQLRKQRVRERQRRLTQSPDAYEVLSLVIEKVPGGVVRGSSAAPPLYVHAVYLNNSGDLEQHEVFRHLVNAPLPVEEGTTTTLAVSSQQPPGLPQQPGGPSREQQLAMRDAERLSRLIEDRGPDVVVVGAKEPQALLLRMLLYERVFPRVSTQQQPLVTLLASLETPAIWAGSDLVPDALRKRMNREALMALSLARFVVDPLAETARLWGDGQRNYFLHLKLHPLQDLIPKERLAAACEAVLLRAVGEAGVDLRRCLRLHSAGSGGSGAALLQLTPGLGPRKAQRLLSSLKAPTLLGLADLRCVWVARAVQMRSQLSLAQESEDEDAQWGGDARGEGLGVCVFRNCASFVQIKGKAASVPEDETLDAMDRSRLHPTEGFSWLSRLCKEALARSHRAKSGGGGEGEAVENSRAASSRSEGGDAREGTAAENENEEGQNPSAPETPFSGGADDCAEDAVAEVLKCVRCQSVSRVLDEAAGLFLEGRVAGSTWPSSGEKFVWRAMEFLSRDPSVLDAVDVEALAEKFKDGAEGDRILPYLRFMADELASPSWDRRLPFDTLSDYEVFFCCSGESPEDVRPGAPLQCRVVAFTPRGALILQHISSPINCGLRDLASLRELVLCRDPNSDLSCLVGHVLTCRILEVRFQLEKHRGLPSFRVLGVCTPEAASAAAKVFVEDAAAAKRMVAFMSPLSMFDLLATRRPLPIQQEDLASLHRRQLLRNRGNVRHPNFKALSHGKALQLLQSSSVPLGEALFRRCSKRDGFVLMLKTCVQPFRTLCLFVDEKEEESPVLEELGGPSTTPGNPRTILTLFGSTYSSLDEIIHRYCEPLRLNLEEINNHPKFRRLELKEALVLLREEALKKPGSISWAILPPAAHAGDAAEEGGSQTNKKDHPLRFSLLVIPPQPAGDQRSDLYLVDGIYVDSKEFKLWTHNEPSLAELIKWWKQDGYWRRKKLLAEYNEVKARAIEENARRRQKREALQSQQQLQQSQMEQLHRRRVEEGLGFGSHGSAMDLVQRARLNQQHLQLREGGVVRERPPPRFKFPQEGPPSADFGLGDSQREPPLGSAGRVGNDWNAQQQQNDGVRGGFYSHSELHPRERDSQRTPSGRPHLFGPGDRGVQSGHYSSEFPGPSQGDERFASYSQRHGAGSRSGGDRPSSRWDVRNQDWKPRETRHWGSDREQVDTGVADDGYDRREGAFETRGNARQSRFDRREPNRNFS